jgi:cytochrome b pre-mRNA-processing protein 3
MYKECERQAKYSMPEVADEADIPQTEEGEDLGGGDTWWHTGRLVLNTMMSTGNISKMLG